jgi:hypothetical protein
MTQDQRDKLQKAIAEALLLILMNKHSDNKVTEALRQAIIDAK